MTNETPQHLRNINPDSVDWKSKDDEYWHSVLSPQQFAVCREAGTERPFSGTYCDTSILGNYHCVCCGKVLFSSDSKFNSGTGWPSFYQSADHDALELRSDISHGMRRTEVLCKRCGSHLGHVFDDGPPPTHQRFCINSLSLYHSD